MIKSTQLGALILFCLFATTALAQFSQIRFERLDARDGLSHNRVNAIYKDQQGFMWFGTGLGLNRYDGNQIKMIKFSESGPFAPGDPNIIWMDEGPGGLLWMKTYFGVFAYDIFRERFINISNLLNELQINSNLNSITKDAQGNYWFMIDEIGIKKFISEDSTVYHYGGAYKDVSFVYPDRNGNMALLHPNGQIELVETQDTRNSQFINYPNELKNTPNLAVFIDQEGGYWFYSTEAFTYGLTYFDPVSNEHRLFDKKDLGSSLITGIVQDKSGRIIVGADHGGLAIISRHDWSIQLLRNNPSDPNSLSHNSIISLYQDDSGLIWIGTHKGGVNYFSTKSIEFSFYKQTDHTNPSVNDIWPLLEGKNGTIWMGTDGGGLVHFDPKTGTYTNYTHKLNDPSSISSNIVVSLGEASPTGLWVGTYFGGLNYFDGSTFKRFVHNPTDPNSISDNSVWVLYTDSKNRLWVGTLKGGIDVYDDQFRKVKHFSKENGRIHSNYITAICEDQNGKVWIGTGYGLEIYDESKDYMHHIVKDGSESSLNSNTILDVFCDTQNNLWIGSTLGLNMYDQAKNRFISFTEKNGLPENLITSIIQDDLGTIWLTGYKGLSKLSFEQNVPVFESFDISDGLQGDIFNERAALKMKNGHLAFGGKNGLNVFDPKEVVRNQEPGKLVFLGLQVANHQIKPGEEFNDRIWFEHGLNSTSKIVLEPTENSITIEFTSLTYFQQENLLYRYRMVGFDDHWITRPNFHQISYTNLNPGRYRFEVMASDQHNTWKNDPIVMEIEVLTPLWKTNWAYLLYALFTIGLLVLIRNFIVQRERFKARISQEQMEAQRLHELDLMKIKFFTNISHEFRTPLTLILSPMEKLLQTENDPKYVKNFNLIFRNAKRLLTLVNQLLDFRKMEANQLKLALDYGDFIKFLRDTVDSFSDLSTERTIHVEFHTDVEQFYTLFDRDKMEKVMFNLLSNAFKFTNPGGKLTIKVHDIARLGTTHTIQVSVQDTGIGIPKDRVQEVFNRFFQVPQEGRKNLSQGSGIGLSITKEFVEMHGGSIWVESKLDVGSTFTFELPMNKLNEEYDETNLRDPDLEEIDHPVNDESKLSILLVDDNADFRFYLRDNLKGIYNVHESTNGKDAWKKVGHLLPDLVVTDITMPELTGIELCQKIKRDPRTANIPVILLTGSYSTDQKLKGYESGAIEYITKPFNVEILIRAIDSAIRFQQQIIASEHLVDVKPSEIEITSLDQQFITKALELVEMNIANSDYSVQELSKDMAVSRAQLYKKTLELTGKSPIEFIRSVRIKRAADLLERSQLNVSEVAYKVGFNNPKYFTKYFKKEFKMLPSRFFKKLE